MKTISNVTSALLISTYNWKDALCLVLNSLKIQSILPNEILIADDGSDDDTKLLIEKFISEIPIPIKHIWHEDLGFRKSKILNKAIANCSCEYIIQIDGDCIMHPNFIEDHLKFASKNKYLYGTRVGIKKEALSYIFKDNIFRFHFFSKNLSKRTRAIHSLFLANKNKTHQDYSSQFRGCNVSFWRTDFIEVNGYNEAFEGWGREDSDLVIRMHNKGLNAQRLRYAGIVYHIYHKDNSRENFLKNDAIQNETIQNKTIRCKYGIDQYL